MLYTPDDKVDEWIEAFIEEGGTSVAAKALIRVTGAGAVGAARSLMSRSPRVTLPGRTLPS